MITSAFAAPPAPPAGASSPTLPAAAKVRLEDYHLLALSPSEGVAVLRGPDRRLVTLRVGTPLVPAQARLAQVLGDKLRFDVVNDKGERHVAWMMRPANPEQLPEVQRVSGKEPLPPTPSTSGRTVTSLSDPATSKK